MDTTAVEAIKEWQNGYARTGILLALIDPNPQITTILQTAGVLETGKACCVCAGVHVASAIVCRQGAVQYDIQT